MVQDRVAFELFGRARVPLLTAAEAAAADRAARERAGVPERVLMENAGRAVAQLVARQFPAGRILGVVGGGNNGGDALVALRTLRSWGREVAWVQAAGRAPAQADALAHGYELPRLSDEDGRNALASAGAILDGILGTGARGEPRPDAAAWIRALNESGRPVLALDLPSGVDPTTGEVPGEAVRAVATLCFGWPKTGLLFQPARGRCGVLLVAEIGFPPPDAPPGAELVTPGWAAARLPARDPAGHKGSHGRVLVLAGRAGMAGAAALAGRGASRAGAGLVRLLSEESNRPILQAAVPEAVFARRDADAALDEAAAGAHAVVAGPGLGLDPEARRALDGVLERTPGLPTLLDADALTVLARAEGAIAALAADRPLLLTPHPGEMSRITRAPIAEIRASPMGAAGELADATGAAVLLKGSPSVVAVPGEPVLVNTAGSSDLGTAGMGDTLAGAIGAFLASGCAVRDAAGLGLFYTARAAELADRGRALLPGDVAEHLHLAFRRPGGAEPPDGLPFLTFVQPERR